MADGAIPDYCTLPRPIAARSVADSEDRQQGPDRSVACGHFYTLRPKAIAMGGVGGRIKPTIGSFRKVQTAEDLAETNRNLLYEQNMSTFENFCERRNSERQLQPHQEPAEESSELTPESLGNFCTLRKVRRVRSGHEDGHTPQEERRREGPLGGAYCTLKKKKLQLNRKFVESFLEDPNAKVVDYLSELDAYLDEMDGMDDVYEEALVSDGDSASDGSEDHAKESSLALANEYQNVGKQEAQKGGEVGESLQYYQPNDEQSGVPGEDDSNSGVTFTDVYQEDRIRFGDIKHFCTLPKQKRTQFLNAFRRGASLRRSIVSHPKPLPADSERRTPDTQNIREMKMECAVRPESMHNAFALSDQLAELEEHQLTIAESDRVVATLEAKIALRRLKSGKASIAPLPFSHFKAYCLDWVRKCETATEKVRFETCAIERQNADRCVLIKQKRQSVGNNALRVHLEGFAIERLVGARELQVAQQTDYDIRRLGAEVKREMLMKKLTLFDTTQQNGRLREDVARWTNKVEAVQKKIERTEQEIESLQRQNVELTAKLQRYRLPTVQDMANRAVELRQLQVQLYARVKKGILDGTIAVPVTKA
uniref:DUF4201 domain-containing protein n=1 Tax=Anopheles epiroticus TaxID=199890 RepID=A0A182PBR6_9DIPT